MTSIRIPIGRGQRGPAFIAGEYANRHGLIAGATGTGKTVTLMQLAEGFSRIGTPVFVADVKGDISALARGDCPARFLDVFGKQGAPLHVSVQRMGPELLARVLGLSEVQAGVFDVIFTRALERNWRVQTLADVRTLLVEADRNRAIIGREFGLIGPASIAAIRRALLQIEREGGADLFQSPSFDVADLESHGKPNQESGIISILAADRLMRSPQLYAATLLFILGDLYERLPEVGDLEWPRLALFFDEAHLFFSDCPPALLKRIEQTMRLIRSKGVAVFFATQSPADIPSTILGQLGNRIQHGLRAATPADARAVRIAAETLPASPLFDARERITTLGVGQALVSTIGPGGVPQPVDVVRVDLPSCKLGPLTDAERLSYLPKPAERATSRGFFARMFG